jgi:hypothetical protein
MNVALRVVVALVVTLSAQSAPAASCVGFNDVLNSNAMTSPF